MPEPETVREEPNEALVEVFESEQESEAMVVQSLLESAGIDVLMTNFDAPQDILPGVGGVIIQVREEQADEARHIIKEYQSGGAKAAEEAEIASEAEAREEPPV